MRGGRAIGIDGALAARAIAVAACLATAASAARVSAAGPEAAGPDKGMSARKQYREGLSLAAADDRRSAERAVPLLWTFLKRNPPEIPEYERAEFHLARALDRVGLHHAAAEYYVNVARGRRDARLLAPALAGLAETVRARPFDAELVVGELLSDTDFGYLPEGVDDFVAFHQGTTDAREGFARWAEARFQDLRVGGTFYWERRYQEAVALIAADDAERARSSLLALDAADVGDEGLARRVDLTLARLDYEAGEYRRALARYESISLPRAERAPLLLERAWCHYRLGEYSRALGLLVALESPLYREFDDPEKYTLRALMLSDVCHFDAAEEAVASFRRAFGPAIRNVYARGDLAADETFRALALRSPEVGERGSFVDALAREIDLLRTTTPTGWEANGLKSALSTLYELKQAEARRRLYLSIEAKVESLGDLLLESEEQMNILEYEIALSRNRRARTRPPEVGELIVDVPASPSIQFYRFDGEYWNDELEDLRVVVEDRCEGMTREGKPGAAP